MHVVVYIKERDKDDESVGSSYHISAQDEYYTSYPIQVNEELKDTSVCYHISFNKGNPQEDEDAKNALLKLEEGV